MRALKRAALSTGSQAGMAGLKNLVVLVAVVVGGFFIVKVADAYIDINGIESDLNSYGEDLAVGSVRDPEYHNNLVEQIEMIREHNNRDVVLLYETLDYAAASNQILVDGYKDINFYVTVYRHNFGLEVKIWR